RGRGRIDPLREPHGVRREPTPVVRDIDERQGSPAAADSLTGPHPLGVPGTPFEIGKRCGTRVCYLLHPGPPGLAVPRPGFTPVACPPRPREGRGTRPGPPAARRGRCG